MKENLKDVRCKNCNKMLGQIKGQAVIKCPRCKTTNDFNK